MAHCEIEMLLLVLLLFRFKKLNPYFVAGWCVCCVRRFIFVRGFIVLKMSVWKTDVSRVILFPFSAACRCIATARTAPRMIPNVYKLHTFITKVQKITSIREGHSIQPSFAANDELDQQAEWKNKIWCVESIRNNKLVFSVTTKILTR